MDRCCCYLNQSQMSSGGLSVVHSPVLAWSRGEKYFTSFVVGAKYYFLRWWPVSRFVWDEWSVGAAMLVSEPAVRIPGGQDHGHVRLLARWSRLLCSHSQIQPLAAWLPRPGPPGLERVGLTRSHWQCHCQSWQCISQYHLNLQFTKHKNWTLILVWHKKVHCCTLIIHFTLGSKLVCSLLLCWLQVSDQQY